MATPLPPASLEAFQAQQKGPRMNSMADARIRTAGNVMDSQPEPGKDPGKDYLADGWGYRVFSDGKIKVISAPEGHRSGAIIDGGPAHEAIMARVKMSTDNIESDYTAPPAQSTPGAPNPPVAPGETSDIDALLNSIPELSDTSSPGVKEPLAQPTVPEGTADRADLTTMRPTEDIDYEALSKGL